MSVAVSLVVAVVGSWGLLRQASHVDAGSPVVEQSSTEQGGAATSSVNLAGPTDAVADRPDVRLVRQVASALFVWDTVDGPDRAAVQAMVVGLGDPSGWETAGLLADLESYLPTVQAWEQLAAHDVSQTLTITDVSVPDSWAGIAETEAERLPVGAEALTVRGERVRDGVVRGQAVRRVELVVFTVLIACPDQTGDCHVLRLSGLNDPLD